jgi:nucleoside-diphosphate-sugar epimerase
MDQNAKIYITGHKGMVGSAIHRCLCSKGYTRIIGSSHAELDLIRRMHEAKQESNWPTRIFYPEMREFDTGNGN